MNQAGVGGYYAPFRYYSPGTSRWLSRDPLDMVDGPNTMSYCVAHPIRYRDPSGLRFLWQGECLLAALGLHRAILDRALPDKFSHCLASCILTFDFGGRCARLAGFLKEWQDIIHGGSTDDSADDFSANEDGIRIGKSACTYKDCAEKCNELHPKATYN